MLTPSWDTAGEQIGGSGTGLEVVMVNVLAVKVVGHSEEREERWLGFEIWFGHRVK